MLPLKYGINFTAAIVIFVFCHIARPLFFFYIGLRWKGEMQSGYARLTFVWEIKQVW